MLIDTNVFLYARGGEHPYRLSCRQVLAGVANGRIHVAASVELVKEYLHVLLRRGVDRQHVANEAAAIGRQCTLHGFDAQVLTLTLTLLRTNDHLGARDAVHAATALTHGIDAVLSADRVFDGIDGLRRVDPTDVAAELA